MQLKGTLMFIHEITIWKRYNQKLKVFEHNHIENEHIGADVPTPISEEQKKGWAGAQWQKEFGLLINGVVTHLRACSSAD
jgi:hypothetical protein